MLKFQPIAGFARDRGELVTKLDEEVEFCIILLDG
jgi:hypothetical protein